jgi:hypothetical protein
MSLIVKKAIPCSHETHLRPWFLNEIILLNSSFYRIEKSGLVILEHFMSIIYLKCRSNIKFSAVIYIKKLQKISSHIEPSIENSKPVAMQLNWILLIV